MPIYEYVCTGCNKKFEVLRPFSKADEATDCPECGKKAERALSTICCFSTDESGMTSSVAGGSSCAGCSSSSCATCHAS